ncbi:MAG: addiction module protein [Chitinophagales bacterium]|nr:addiction module protein [Chitinophagales bacterium]
MDLKLKKRAIKARIDKTDDEKALWAIARILNLDQNEPEWHKQEVKERFADYERNPQNVISWKEIKKKWKDEV